MAKTKWLLLLIIVISMLIGAGTLRRGHVWGDDWAWYTLQAKSVVDGTTDDFMRTSAFTNTESTTYVGPLAYPWGYPLILVPAYLLRGIHPLVLKLPALLFFAAFLVSLYLLMRNRLSEMESLLIVALFAFNPLMIQSLDEILSDIPFLFFSTLSLWLLTREGKRSPWYNILIGVCIFFVVFIRATGILLLASFLFVEFIQLIAHRRDRDRIKRIILDSGTVLVSFFVLYAISSLLFPNGGSSYLAQFAGTTIETIRKMAGRYFEAYGLFFGASSGWTFLYYVLIVFFLIGVWRRWREDLLFVVFLVSWMILHIAYPYWQSPRYLFPVLPIFIYFIFQGMKFVIGKLPPERAKAGQWAFNGFWSLLIAAFLLTSAAGAYSNLQNNREISGPFDPYSKEVYKYIQEQTPASSVIIFFKPRVMKLMTGHDTIMSTECGRMYKGDYLVLSRKVGRNQQIPPEEIAACDLPLKEVLKNNRFIVYQLQQ